MKYVEPHPTHMKSVPHPKKKKLVSCHETHEEDGMLSLHKNP